MADDLRFRSQIRFETPQENNHFEGQTVRYALTRDGEVHLAFFNARGERCSFHFTVRDVRAVLDFKLLWSLFRR